MNRNYIKQMFTYPEFTVTFKHVIISLMISWVSKAQWQYARHSCRL